MAIKKLPGPESTIYVTELEDGQLQASVMLPNDPFVIWGNPGHNKAAAKAKLCYAVIKHVNTELGIPIFDINYPVKSHQDRFISRFDRKMKGIWQCGEKLDDMLNGIDQMFVRATDELAPRLAQNVHIGDVVAACQAFTVRLAHLRGQFMDAKARLAEFKVSILCSTAIEWFPFCHDFFTCL